MLLFTDSDAQQGKVCKRGTLCWCFLYVYIHPCLGIYREYIDAVLNNHQNLMLPIRIQEFASDARRSGENDFFLCACMKVLLMNGTTTQRDSFSFIRN